jgi:HSP20 family protein
MTLVRWDPFREMARMQNEINRLFDDRAIRQEDLTAGFWPPVDVYQDHEQIVLTCELPGMDAKEVDLQVENGVLTIRGERKLEREDKKDNYVRVERWYGTFNRAFTLPTTVDADKVKAEFKNGVLRVTLPRKEETKPKQIKVKVE